MGSRYRVDISKSAVGSWDIAIKGGKIAESPSTNVGSTPFLSKRRIEEEVNWETCLKETIISVFNQFN
jgi:hypothetical protein